MYYNFAAESFLSKKLRRRLHSIEVEFYSKLESGPMPNVMAALPNIGGALCSLPESLADAQYCSAVQ